MMERAPVVMAGCAMVATAATFAPWATSGSRTRSSYEVVDVADRAGILPAGLAPLAATWWLVPVLCGLVLVAAASSRVRLSAAAAGTLGALVAVGGVLVARSPLVVEPGAAIGSAAGVCTVSAAIVVLATARRGRNG